MNFDFDQIFQFLFQSYGGIGVLILCFLVISVIAGFALEGRTQKLLDKRKRAAAKKYAESQEVAEDDVDDKEEPGAVEKINKDEL